MRLSRPYSFSDQTLGNHSPHPWGHGKPSEPPWDAPIANLWCGKLKEGSISACSARKFFGGERWNSHRHNGSIMTISRPRPVRASPRRAQPRSGEIGTILAPAQAPGHAGAGSEAPLAVLHIHPGNSEG